METRKNNYNFSILDNLESDINKYNVVLIIYTDLISIFNILKQKFKLDLTNNINLKESIVYKGNKGECNIFYNNYIKYIFVKTNTYKSDKLLGIIGKNILNEDRQNISLLVINNETNDIPNINYINSLLQGLYRFDELKTVNSININTTFFYTEKLTYIDEINKKIAQNKILYEIRDLANYPVNILNSTKYEEIIMKGLSGISNIKITVKNKKELEENGLNLILAVNKGSNEEPKMIILDYSPPDQIDQQPICLVGKGVMYDTGGLNLKTGNMVEMKTDMIGSALVYGLLKAFALNKCNKRVVGILPIVQNDIGSSAVHPGDVIKSYSGKTVEITHTDAEGRLILADGIAYCKNYNPLLIIDIGTLTGQVCNIFNNLATVIMSNTYNTTSSFKIVCSLENENVWELPLWPEYIKETKSDNADFRNYSFNKADTIMCGAFLSNFIPNQIPWIHLDIGGVSYNEKETATKCAGATGTMFNSLYNFIYEFKDRSLF